MSDMQSNIPTERITSVFDMVSDYANQSNINMDDIFKPTKTTINTNEISLRDQVKDDIIEDEIDMLQPSIDNESLVSLGAIYSTDEVKFEEQQTLINSADESLVEDTYNVMDTNQRILDNIEKAKAALGIKQLQIPPSEFQVKLITLAGSSDPELLPNLISEMKNIVELFPEAVKEWLPGREPNTNTSIPHYEVSEVNNAIDIVDEEVPPSSVEDLQLVPLTDQPTDIESANLTVIIDKSQAPSLVFTDDELAKIQKVRKVEVDIVEDMTMRYNIIPQSQENDIDIVLSEHTRKFNDIAVSLPASRYRCTITGLSYPEILDLSYSQELNNTDGERQKWSIAYKHIKNPSIGNFIDFTDFLKKTSFMDLDYILWTLLCATSMSQEIVTIRCNAKNCGNSYEWLYAPRSLLKLDQINQTVLEDMKATGEAQTEDEILNHYNQSMLRLDNSVELPSSKFVLCFGHVSAYDYIESIFGKIESMRNNQSAAMVSEVAGAVSLTILKYVLLPSKNVPGSYYKIIDPDGIIKIVNMLNEIDFKLVDELTTIMTTPYNLQFQISNIVCPRCRQKSNIDIEDMSHLLFVITQSLSNVNVTLRK